MAYRLASALRKQPHRRVRGQPHHNPRDHAEPHKAWLGRNSARHRHLRHATQNYTGTDRADRSRRGYAGARPSRHRSGSGSADRRGDGHCRASAGAAPRLICRANPARAPGRWATSIIRRNLPRERPGGEVLADDLETEPIFSLLEQKYGTPLLEAEYQLEAVSADTFAATALRIRVGDPIFLIERTSYSEGHRPVDHEKLHYRGDQIRFVTRLARRVAPALQMGGVRDER